MDLLMLVGKLPLRQIGPQSGHLLTNILSGMYCIFFIGAGYLGVAPK